MYSSTVSTPQTQIVSFLSEERQASHSGVTYSDLTSQEHNLTLSSRFDHFEPCGDTLRSFTKADLTKLQSSLRDCQKYRSEVSVHDIFNQFSVIGDKARDLPSDLMDQLTHLSSMVTVLGDSTFINSVNFDARYLADITTQVLMALKLISLEPSMTNLTLVFTSVLTKLNLSRETLTLCIEFIKDSLHVAISSISSIGYKSEASISQMISIFKSMCGTANELIEDQVVDIVLSFLAKLVSFWVTLSGGFSEDDFNVSNIPQIVAKMRSIISNGGDIIECIIGTYEWIVEHFTTFIKGDFSALFFGKAETSAYESRISKAKKIYPIVASGSEQILKEEYGYTFSSYDAEVSDLVKLGDRMMLKAKSAQKPSLKRMIDEMREVQTDRRLKQAQTQTKVSAIGICFVGGSGVGKSLLMDQTSRTIICAAGEVPSSSKIVTGQMSDKFDSNELPHHLSIQYDDVSNNSNNENFDKLLNAINSQSRPFLKAAVEEKGVMFPGNLACVISTNVPGLNANKSNCADSIARRFLHIDVKIKPDLISKVCVPGTKRVDPTRATHKGEARMDIWQFDVYEFITFDKEEDDEEDTDPSVIRWEGMYVRKLTWTDKKLEDQTFWDLALFIKNRAKDHFASQKIVIKNMILKQQEIFCVECCIPNSVCVCNTVSEFRCGSVDTGIVTLINNYNTYTNAFSTWWDMAKMRSMVGLSFALAPVDYEYTLISSAIVGLIMSVLLRMTFLTTILFTIIFAFSATVFLVYRAWKLTYDDISTRYGVLSQLAEDSMESMRLHRNKIFAGASMISFAYLIYRSFRPKSQQVSYRETLPENIRSAFSRAEKARTTPIDNILPHMKRDLGIITVNVDGKSSKCLAFPIDSNCYVTVGHVIPKSGDFEIIITHENSLTPTVAKQKLNNNHVYRFPNKDLVLIQVPSAVPRRGYRDFLLGRDTPRGNQAVHLVSMKMEDSTRYISTTRMEPGWSIMSSSVKTDKVTLYKPYRYAAPLGTEDGMCGSLVVDYSKAIIYGFHVAGNGKTGLCDTLTRVEVDLALSHFEGFLPLNQGDLQLGSNSLEKGLGFIELVVDDVDHDKPIEEHNCVVEGIIPGASASFKDPYRLHTFKDAIRKEFGKPQFKPPQGINDPFHKRKALSKLTTPNQEFSLQELALASSDYKAPIIAMIKAMSPAKAMDIGRVLSTQEALDGLVNDSLGGIDNSTSVGFPFRGKKKDFLERDPMDPNIPLTPRELKEFNGVNVLEEVAEMEKRYRANITCRPLFKCSMKTNELLTITKKKARIFMGSNFPFLIICRKYLAPIIRMMSKNKLLFESAKGINMDSVEAEDLYNFLKVEEGEKVVALDYSAFDQTMSAQASTAAAGIMVDLMRAMNCSEDHIQIVRGILTDITYPTLHFFGTVMQLANSDPSGNPITTELNGMVNSIYLRIFFFRIYPELINKVSYREAIKTATYGDDNINAVPAKFAKFNGLNIVEEGKKVGLGITMADKDAAITDFTKLENSDFLKRKFRFCPDMKRIRAPLLKESIEKSIHWMKKTSPDPPEILFSQNVDGMLRKSSQHGRDYFDEIRAKLIRIAETHDVMSLSKWWTYDELIAHDKHNYYENHRGLTLYDVNDKIDVYSDFKSESFKSESFTQFKPTISRFNLAATIMTKVFEWIIALIPFINTGRFLELGLNPSMFFRFLGLCATIHTFLPESNIPALKQGLWSRLGHGLRVTFVNMWLRHSNDIIREQPFCILLEGGAGVGKTTCAIALVKSLCQGMNITRSDIIVLNESDEFQSELRSNHKVIIIDDLANTHVNFTQETPLRRIIDIVNNVPRRALSPDVELKGNVKIQPILVIITTNVKADTLRMYTACPDSLFRRWKRYAVAKKPKYIFSYDKLDTDGWLFSKYLPVRIDANSTYSKTGYANESPIIQQFPTVVSELKQQFSAHREEQAHLVKIVNEHFDAKEPKFKSESLDWDNTLIEEMKLQELTPENFMAMLSKSCESIVSQNNLDDFDEVPVRFRELPPPETWWTWFKNQFYEEQFLSESKDTRELLPSELQSLEIARERVEYHNVPVVVFDDFVWILDYSNTLIFTTRKGPQEAAKINYLFQKPSNGNVYYMPNYITIDSWKSYYDTLGFKSESQDDLVDALCQSRLDNVILSYQMCCLFLMFVIVLCAQHIISFTPKYKRSKVTLHKFDKRINQTKDHKDKSIKVKKDVKLAAHKEIVANTLARLERKATDEKEYKLFSLGDSINPATNPDLYRDSLPLFTTCVGFMDAEYAHLFPDLKVESCPHYPEHESQRHAHCAIIESNKSKNLKLIAREVKIAKVSYDLIYVKVDKNLPVNYRQFYVAEAKQRSMSITTGQTRVRIKAFQELNLICRTGFCYTLHPHKLKSIGFNPDGQIVENTH